MRTVPEDQRKIQIGITLSRGLNDALVRMLDGNDNPSGKSGLIEEAVRDYVEKHAGTSRTVLEARIAKNQAEVNKLMDQINADNELLGTVVVDNEKVKEDFEAKDKEMAENENFMNDVKNLVSKLLHPSNRADRPLDRMPNFIRRFMYHYPGLTAKTIERVIKEELARQSEEYGCNPDGTKKR